METFIGIVYMVVALGMLPVTYGACMVTCHHIYGPADLMLVGSYAIVPGLVFAIVGSAVAEGADPVWLAVPPLYTGWAAFVATRHFTNILSRAQRGI